MKTYVTLITTGDGVETYTLTKYAGTNKEKAEERTNYTLKEFEEGFNAVIETWENDTLIERNEVNNG